MPPKITGFVIKRIQDKQALYFQFKLCLKHITIPIHFR